MRHRITNYLIICCLVLVAAVALVGPYTLLSMIVLSADVGLAILFTVRAQLERKSTSQNQSVALARYRSMLDNLPVGVYRSTADGRILEANLAFAQMLGYESIEELRNVKDIYVSRSDCIRRLEKLRESTVFTEFELKAKDGQGVWVRDYPRAILNADGYVDYIDGVVVQTQGIEAVVRGITEHRKLETIKDRFLSAVTHELRTPLVSIKGYAEFILAEDPNATLANIRPFVDVVRRNANRLLQLTDDLLDIQRLESGKAQIRIQETDFGNLVRQCIQEIQPLLEQKALRLRSEIPQGPIRVHVDPLRISQAVLNLLNNAIKFTADNGCVTIRVNEDSDNVQVSVRDTGIGISKNDLGRVFEPFAAIEKPTYFKGTGLGLSLSKRLVEAHGGTISVSSAGRGQGSTFTLVLPKECVEVAQ